MKSFFDSLFKVVTDAAVDSAAYVSTLFAAPVAAVAGAANLVKRAPPSPAAQSPEVALAIPAESAHKSPLSKLTASLYASVVAMEDRYQRWMQVHINPLFNKNRNEQLNIIQPDRVVDISQDEKLANRSIGLGAISLTASALAALVFAPLSLVALGAGILAMGTSYREGWKQLKAEKKISGIHLMLIYLALMWLGGHMAVGGMGLLLLGIGYKIKAITENYSRQTLTKLFQLQPRTIWVRSGGLEVEIAFDQLQLGDTVVLQAGQVVPVDGRILSGAAVIDQHMLTGESQPAEKTVGDPVLAATNVISGKIDVRVERSGSATTAGQIGEMLNKTAGYGTAMALKVVKATDRLAVPTLALGAVSWPFLGTARAGALLGSNFTVNTLLTGPLTSLNFINLSSARGILVKDGKAIEQIGEVDTFVFDKTGTLTLDQPSVAQIHSFHLWSESAVLMAAAAAEVRQSHPVARAILAAAEARHLVLPEVAQAHYEIGMGIKVWIPIPEKESREAAAGSSAGGAADLASPPRPLYLVRVGSSRFMALEGVAIAKEVHKLIEDVQAQGHSVVLVACDARLVGAIELRPTIRPEAKAIIDGLRERGKELYIISGDQEAPTRQLAEELGMTGYFANTLPEQKASLVEELQQRGRRVCFIGDGINDAIAMRKAEVSISLRGATSAATDTAQIIMMEGNLSQLLLLLELAQKFSASLRLNFRTMVGLSLFTVAGIFFAGFTFVTTELMWTTALLISVGIASKPLLDGQRAPSS